MENIKWMSTFYCKTKDKTENKKTNHFVVTKLLIFHGNHLSDYRVKMEKSSGL